MALVKLKLVEPVKAIIAHDIFDDAIGVVYSKSEEVLITHAWISEGHWHRTCPDIWVETVVVGVILEGYESTMMLTNAFSELDTDLIIKNLLY